jgi:solute carrier family 27 fatty acid transporter 1/4
MLIQMEEYSWRVAQVFSQMGLAHGDVVALMCSNCPEFVAIWVGLSRLGVVTALINTNLRYTALTHSLKVASPRVVIASSEFCSGKLIY